MYLTIPEVTEAEDLLSVDVESDGKTFRIMIGMTETATSLFRTSADGSMIPLVVVATDAAMYALDEVYVTEASVSGDSGGDPTAFFSLQAQAVRFF